MQLTAYRLCLAVLMVAMLPFFLAAQNSIPNSSFEDWGTADPAEWSTSNIPPVLINITQSSDAYAGSFAVRGEVIDFGGSIIPPLLYAGVFGAGFPVSQNYSTMTGYYKFSPVAGDFIAISVFLFSSQPNGGFGEGFLNINNSTANYTLFTIDIEYFASGPVDQAAISIIINGPGEFPNIGSWMVIDDLAFSGVSALSPNEDGQLPSAFSLEQNYPNPFNPSTTIEFSLPQSELVTLDIYNLRGEKVTTLVSETLTAGGYKYEWDAAGLASGVYFYRLAAGNFIETRKMVLMR